MFSRLAFAAVLLAAPLAAAQTPPPPTAAQVAEARKIADDLIRAGDAGAYFENATDGAVPRVRHVPSGMICVFSGDGRDGITIFPTQTPDVPRGNDVGCVWYDAATRTDYTLYATRYADLPPAEAVLGSAVRAIVARYPDAKPYEGDISVASVEGEIEPVAAAFVIDTPAGTRLTLAMVAHRGEWSYKMRASGPIEDATGVSMTAGVYLVAALLDMLPKRAE